MGRTIRVATPADADQILAIYAPIVQRTPISFDTEVPAADRIAQRISNTLRTLPWLVEEENGTILGYAYAAPLRDRSAYAWSVEVSVYVRPDARTSGVGRSLVSEILEMLTRQGYVNVFGAVSLPNQASVRLMEGLGFVPVGVFRQVGYKLGAWHDVGWWQRTLSPHEEDPSPPIPFSELDR